MSDYKVLDSNIAYDGFIKIQKHIISDQGNEFVREVCVSKDAVFILPYDPSTRKVVLIKEPRTGLIGREDSVFTYSSIAGMIDKDCMTPEDIAIAELNAVQAESRNR